MQLRVPFQLAKMQKMRDFNTDFSTIFLGADTHTGEGLWRPTPDPTPPPLGAPALFAFRASLTTVPTAGLFLGNDPCTRPPNPHLCISQDVLQPT